MKATIVYLIEHNHTARLTRVKSEKLKIGKHRICGTMREIRLQYVKFVEHRICGMTYVH